LLLQSDLRALFDYIEPADQNLGAYSFRTLALLLRACVEVEANCKAILKENGYSKGGDWTMRDYRKIEHSHRLSSFEVVVPNWSGLGSRRAPFAAWKASGSLPWYEAYNAAKHDRHNEFQRASFGHLIDACCAVFILLSAQFLSYDFTGYLQWTIDKPGDGSDYGVGQFFRVVYPSDWDEDEQYAFDWGVLKETADPFASFDYSKVP
jgi:hypothetical protein